MGHDKLRKFAENESFACLLQPSAADILGSGGYFALTDHPVKGHWREFFAALPYASSSLAGPASSSGLVLELGCGKGEYTVALAQRDPSRNYVGVDIKGARLWKGAKFATQNRLPNVGFLRTRVEFITALFAPGEVSEIWLTFSDPQFRSENSRLSSPLFLERYRNICGPDGIVHLKTDSRFLHEYTRAVCEANSLEVIACTQDLYGTEGGDGIPPVAREVQTFYETLFREQGYAITYLSFRLRHDGPYVHPTAFDAEYWRSVEGPRLLFGHDSAETRRRKLAASASENI